MKQSFYIQNKLYYIGKNPSYEQLCGLQLFTRLKNSARCSALWNCPFSADEIIQWGVLIPRAVMQRCSPFAITATSSVPNMSISSSAMSETSFSCKVRLWACLWAIRANLDRPNTFHRRYRRQKHHTRTGAYGARTLTRPAYL